jgi:error-prone DNA polymerase
VLVYHVPVGSLYGFFRLVKKSVYLTLHTLARHFLISSDVEASVAMAKARVNSTGAFDDVTPNRRAALWESRLYHRPTRGQQVLPLSMDHDVPDLEDFSDYQKMMQEYRVMGVHPKNHLMAYIRSSLPARILRNEQVYDARDGDVVTVAGWPIARQHPRGENSTVFITVEDETGDLQLILWPHVVERHRKVLKAHVIVATGEISRWDGTTNVIVSKVESISMPDDMPEAHNWH